MKKQFQIYVYSKTGEYIDVIEESEFSGKINFIEKINHGFQAFSFNYIVRGKTIDDYDSELINELNKIEIVVSNPENPEGKTIYSGYMSRIKKNQSGIEKNLQISCLGIQYLMATNSEFTQTFTAEDPKVVIESAIDSFNSEHEGGSGIANFVEKSDISSFGSNIDLDLIDETWFRAIVKAHEVSDESWFFRFEPDWGFKFSERSATSQHEMDITDHVYTLTIDPNPEEIENVIEFEYSSGTVSVEDSDSIEKWGRRKKGKHVDITIQDLTTATRRANTILSEKKSPKIKIICEINNLYDIESIRVGDVVEFIGVKEGSFLDENLLQVSEITYKNGERVRISFDDYEENLAEEIEKMLN